MPAKKLYSDFYEYDSTARKRQYLDIPEEKVAKTIKTQKRIIKKEVKRNNVAIMVFIFTGFFMTMVITYRFNLINERNLKTQNLKTELTSVQSELLSTQIELEQSTDLNSIEAYAKQKLGMQKPNKNQTIYVDTSTTIQKIEVEEESTTMDMLIAKVKNIINNIF